VPPFAPMVNPEFIQVPISRPPVEARFPLRNWRFKIVSPPDDVLTETFSKVASTVWDRSSGM
jgi:hypothetical protein